MPFTRETHIFWLISALLIFAWWMVTLELRTARAERATHAGWGSRTQADVEAQISKECAERSHSEGKAGRSPRMGFGLQVPATIWEEGELDEEA